MPIIDPLEEDQIEPALREHVQFFKGPLGVVPNSVRTIARRPDIARAFTDLNIAVMECAGKVTPEFKRLIGFATSMVSGCRYCQAHTVLGSERFGTTEERLNSIFDYARSPHFTSAEKAALDFAFAAAEIPNGVTDEHAENLRAHWSDEDIVEIMGVIGLFGFLNRWNDSMGSALEDLPTQAGKKYLGSNWTVGKHGQNSKN